MITKTITLKLFTECDAELQQKILNKYYDINLDSDLTIYDDRFILNIEDAGFLNPKIYYDLSGCQGSGACFDCKDFDIDKLLQNINIPHKKWFIDILKNQCELYIRCINNHYEHEHTRTFEIGFTAAGYYKHIEDILYLIQDKLEQLRLSTCKQLYQDLQNEYTYLISDDAIKETLICNEYYFNDNGIIEQP